ncbi:UNVERIFIED_ORG: hypothetical protein MaF1660_ph0021 [Mycobacterium phage Adler]
MTMLAGVMVPGATNEVLAPAAAVVPAAAPAAPAVTPPACITPADSTINGAVIVVKASRSDRNTSF